ncbi:hypothetical protein RYX36_013857 [Vicia faba]
MERQRKRLDLMKRIITFHNFCSFIFGRNIILTKFLIHLRLSSTIFGRNIILTVSDSFEVVLDNFFFTTIANFKFSISTENMDISLIEICSLYWSKQTAETV